MSEQDIVKGIRKLVHIKPGVSTQLREADCFAFTSCGDHTCSLVHIIAYDDDEPLFLLALNTHQIEAIVARNKTPRCNSVPKDFKS